MNHIALRIFMCIALLASTLTTKAVEKPSEIIHETQKTSPSRPILDNEIGPLGDFLNTCKKGNVFYIQQESNPLPFFLKRINLAEQK